MTVLPAPVRGDREAAASRARPRPRVSGLVLGLVLLAVVALAGLTTGSRDMSIPEVLRALSGVGSYDDLYTVWVLRIPRTVMALVVGAALGISGALMQAMTRNPLADPGILGANAGAAFAVALGIALWGVHEIGGYMWFAFGGALAVTALVHAIGSAGTGPATPLRLTLAGVAVGAVLSGITTAITLRDPDAFDRMRSWHAGSVVGRDLDLLGPVLPFLVLGVVCAALAAGPLNAIAMGDDLARSLGAHVHRTRVLVLVAVTLLAGGATALAGPIGFVGLMIPHVARWIVGPDQRWILVHSLVLAPLLVVAADVLGRQITSGELPVGIVTAFVGAPVLIVLARRRRASGL